MDRAHRRATLSAAATGLLAVAGALVPAGAAAAAAGVSPGTAVEICKALAPGSDSLTGRTFSFSNDGTSQSLQALAPGALACTMPLAVPSGTAVPVGEVQGGGYRTASIELQPTGTGTATLSDTDLTAGTAAVTVTSGTATVVFTNAAVAPAAPSAALEVCKTLATGSPLAGRSFRFDLPGGTRQLIAVAGQTVCSSPLPVTAGQPVAVREEPGSSFHVSDIEVDTGGGVGQLTQADVGAGSASVTVTSGTVKVEFTNVPTVAAAPLAVTAAAPFVRQARCTGGTFSGATYTVPTTPGVTYLLHGSPVSGVQPAPAVGTVVVTPVAQPGYTLTNGAPFTLVFAGPTSCQTPPAPQVAVAPQPATALPVLAPPAAAPLAAVRRPPARHPAPHALPPAAPARVLAVHLARPAGPPPPTAQLPYTGGGSLGALTSAGTGLTSLGGGLLVASRRRRYPGRHRR